MKHVNITPAKIVNNMDESAKHNLSNYCLANKIEPEEILNTISNVVNGVVNLSIDFVGAYLKTPAGKEYINMRKKIENIGQKYK